MSNGTPPGQPQNNYDAVLDPTINNDQSEGYTPGSKWVNIVGLRGWQCMDASKGVAVWLDITQAPSFNIDYFLTDTADPVIGGYDVMQNSATGEVESSHTLAAAGGGDDQLIASFITPSGEPGIIALRAGTLEGHFHTERTGGTRTFQTYWTLSKRVLAGAETLLVTSETSSDITTKIAVRLHGTLGEDVDLLITDRLVLKVYANLSATPASPTTVVHYQEGTTDSRISIGVGSDVLSQIFLRRDGTVSLFGNMIIETDVELQFGDAGHAIIKGDGANLVIDPMAGIIDTNVGDIKAFRLGLGGSVVNPNTTINAGSSGADIFTSIAGVLTYSGAAAIATGLAFTAKHSGGNAAIVVRGCDATGQLEVNSRGGETSTLSGVIGTAIIGVRQTGASTHTLYGVRGVVADVPGGHTNATFHMKSLYGAAPPTGIGGTLLGWALQIDGPGQINGENRLLLGGTDTALGLESLRASASSIIFEANSGDEMTVAADNLTFNNGATATGLAWGTNGRLDFKVGLGIEMSMAANTLTFNTGASDPVLNWATSGLLKQTTGSFEVTVGYIAVADGMVAPGAGAGLARIYVDTADGDLKVVFANGFIAVLAADS